MNCVICKHCTEVGRSVIDDVWPVTLACGPVSIVCRIHGMVTTQQGTCLDSESV